MFLLLQATTIAFAISLAWLNKIPVNKMRDFGASIREEKEFHAANALVKVLFASVCAVNHSLFVASLLFVLSLTWQWLVFDIALNRFTCKELFYVGETSAIDKWLNRNIQFAGPGEAKAALCIIGIIGLNLIYFL